MRAVESPARRRSAPRVYERTPGPSTRTHVRYILPTAKPQPLPQLHAQHQPRAQQQSQPQPRARQIQRRASAAAPVEGSGGASGVVLPLNLDGDGINEAVYTLSLAVGANGQVFSVQVDTGSSDFWLAGSDCGSCGKSALYNPSAALPTGQAFNITYLAGGASGPIYWDTVDVGGYVVGSQALAAISFVSSEPLDSSFNGVLGLALPDNSIIEQLLPATESNNPDGAIWASNLFGLTPTGTAPASRFLSVSLQRPGMDGVPSLLGIGMHPSSLVHDPAAIKYSSLVRTQAGELFWQASVRDITVYVDGQARTVSLPHSTAGAVFPTAVLDTGVPYVLASTTIANAVYGALGIGPGSDGQYYLPCETPINMTITLDGQPALPLHPLDLSAVPSSSSQSSTCIGLIQTAGGALDSARGSLPDMVLGVAFLRSVYTVLAFDEPFDNGTFPNVGGANIQPHLGLMGLLNITQALDEFHTVRVLGQPLTSHTTTTATGDSSKGLSVGIKIIIGLFSFVGLCAVLFGGFWFFIRRRYRRDEARGIVRAGDGDGSSGDALDLKDYGTGSRSSRREKRAEGTNDSARTRVGEYDELGLKSVYVDDEDGFLNLDPSGGGWRTTLVGDNEEPRATYDSPTTTYEPYEPVPTHTRNDSDATASSPERAPAHSASEVQQPLLAHTRDASRSLGLEDADAEALRALELGGARVSMAGVGSGARRGASFDARHGGSLHDRRDGSFDARISPGDVRASFMEPGQPSLLEDGRTSPLNARFPAMAMALPTSSSTPPPPGIAARDPSPARMPGEGSVSFGGLSVSASSTQTVVGAVPRNGRRTPASSGPRTPDGGPRTPGGSISSLPRTPGGSIAGGPLHPTPRRSVSPRPGSAARIGALPLADVPASDFEFLSRRSHAFALQEPPSGSKKQRGRS